MIIVFLDKFVDPSLTLDRILFNILGINRRSAYFVLSRMGLNGSLRLQDVTALQLLDLEGFLTKKFTINDKRLNRLRSYRDRINNTNSVRAYRFRNKLPVNGQRTHSNARTQRK